MDFLKNIYIIDAARTPIGSTFKGLKDFSAAQLGALTIKEILKRNKIEGSSVGQVILGNTVSAGAGQNIARQAAVLSGLPVTVPAFTVNNVCGSGLQAMIFAAHAIACRESDIIVAGGSESASQSPYVAQKSDKDKTVEEVSRDSLVYDGLTCLITGKHMGELAEFIAEKFGIGREEQDLYALESHRKACAAQGENKFSQEIIPLQTKEGKIIDSDERPRKNASMEKLSQLPAAFKKGGSVTAGNSCIPCDGAAIFILASGDAVKKYKLTPKARILGFASVAVEPKMVFTAAAASIKECLKRSGLSMEDIDLFEVCEAFAAQALLTRRELNIPPEKMNIWGGDVALGHPLGTAGTRILVTLIHALIDQKKKIGLAAVCLGGGGSVAVAVEIIG